jgi:DNA-binding NarL/FixJ family response regulator
MSLTHAQEGGATRVVVLDDSKTVLASVRHAMEKQGFEVRTATCPSELSPEEARVAHVFVVDVHMQEVFGDDVVSFLRDQWEVTAPIYLYSSVEQEELERRAQRAGATGAVCKARGVDALVQSVLTGLGSQ